MAYLKKHRKSFNHSSAKRQAPPPPPSPREQATMLAFHPLVSAEELQHVPLGARAAYQKCFEKHDGKSLEKRGEFLKKAFDLAPNNPYTLFRIAFLLAVEKDPKAKETMDRAVNLSRSLGVPLDKIERSLTRAL